MSRQLFYLIPTLLAGAFAPARAATVACSLQTGTTGVFVAQACNQQIVNPTASLNWATVLTANGALVTGPFSASIGSNSVSVASSDQFQGADNTALAWDGGEWVPAGFVTTATTFAGHFNSETTPTGPAPEPILGENLLGILAPSGNSTGNTTATFTFAQTLGYVEFEVTSRTGASGSNGVDTNFTADLVAMDASGHIIGTYQVMDTGGGGLCAGLSNGAGPQPCNDAPFVQFYDPQDQIKSVELIVNDQTGAYIDTLEVASVQDATIPEPSSFALFGIGMLALLWASRRAYSRHADVSAGSALD
jgi:PEP-CTERM motif